MTEETPVIEPIDITVRAVLTGKSPLLMHNPRTCDDEDEYKIQINEIVAKGTDKTPEDRKRKESLQWRACLYTEQVKEEGGAVSERLIVPITWLSRALEEGGKTLGNGTKSKGAAVVRSVTPTETFMLLEYDGPQDIVALGRDPRYRYRTYVNPNPSKKGGKLPSVRAKFPTWGIATTLHVVTDMGLSYADFERAFRAAGSIGIGDGRKLAFGRFSVKLTKLR